MIKAPMPEHREGKVSLWRYARLFRRDLLSAQPKHLYHALMAEFKTPFFSSYLVNDLTVVDQVLRDKGDQFPKSERQSAGLAPLLGQSVFVSNHDTWRAQRRIIDPAFEAARLGIIIPHIEAAAIALCARLKDTQQGVNVEPLCSYAAADVIFRTLFSVPIEDEMAHRVYLSFQAYQSAQPLLNLAALGGRWRFGVGRKARRAAQEIRALIADMVDRRRSQIEAGTAPDDLATRIMTTPDPQTGACFSNEEMLDQVAIFFLAGHETSAAALSWALYLAALDPDWQAKMAAEARQGALSLPISKRPLITAHFRETLRLYPPVPMMVRTSQERQVFRKRSIAKGAQIIISPWHLHRHDRIWNEPHMFDPKRFLSHASKEEKRAFIPFSKGPRVCPGASFALTEGVMTLAAILRQFDVAPTAQTPVPMAHLTVRSKSGIVLRFTPRG